MSDAIFNLLTSGVALFGQGSRLLKLRFTEGSGFTEETLLPHRVVAEERLSTCYRYELDCLSPDTHLELKELLGQPCEIALLLPAGGYRLLTGLVTGARQTGGDGGFAGYHLTIEPALATLTHRRNSRVFQDQSVPQIVTALLDEHLAANPAFTASFKTRSRLTRDYPSRSYCLQYRETDLAFIERLLAEEGISYRFTHGPDPDTSLTENAAEAGDPIVHTLILLDPESTHPPASDAPIRFHRTDGIEMADAIDHWQGSRQLQAGQTQLTSWDYKAATHTPASEAQRTQHSDTGNDLTRSLEDYDPQAGYYGSNPDDQARYATLRQQARDLASKTFEGQGTARHLLPGTWFQLHDHPIHDQDNAEDREFLVASLTFAAENNLTPDAKQSLAGLLTPAGSTGQDPDAGSGSNRPPYRNTFSAVRRHVPVVPEFQHSRHQKPTAHGLTTATVVGPAGEEIFTDEHGRIKIQFHWQRKQDHPDGGANLDERSSTWVRVALPSAGATWGSQYIPRIGQEVVIDFIESDIDRPLVTGVVYNGAHRPPTFSGTGSLPANKTLSGHKSKEYKGNRYNELLFDDSTGEIRTKLSSEHGKTQLNQGYLIHPRSEGKGEARGEGFELRTDEAGTLRAAKGLLLSTWQRLNASDKQLARSEALDLMQQSLELFKQLGEYAAQHEALPIDSEPQQKLNEKFKDWEQGSNTAKGGSNGQSPIIGITAPGGIHQSTPESLVGFAGKNIDQIAQQHIQQSAGQRFNLNAGKGISLFAHEEGLKAIAHHGKLLLQSQHDDTVVNAEQNVMVTASQGKIVGMAEKEIVWINSAGAYVKLSGANIEIGCPGSFTVKAATHNLLGPASMASDLPQFSDGELGRKFKLIRPTDGRPMANVPYKITLCDGGVFEGKTNAAGDTELLEGDRFKIARSQFFTPPTEF